MRKDHKIEDHLCFKKGGSVPHIEIMINMRHENPEIHERKDHHEKKIDSHYASFPKGMHHERHKARRHHDESENPTKGDSYDEAMSSKDYSKEKAGIENNRAQSDDKLFGGKKEERGSLAETNGYRPKLNTPAEKLSLGKSDAVNYRKGGKVHYDSKFHCMETEEIRKLERASNRFENKDHDHPQTKAHPYKEGSTINIKHPGRLHAKLGVPKGEKIPMKLIKSAEHSKSKSLRKEAQFADNFRNRPQGR